MHWNVEYWEWAVLMVAGLVAVIYGIGAAIVAWFGRDKP
jgi:hypothetical protein